MDRFFGFDLGDAESAVSRLDKKDQTVPEVLEVCGKKSFITAYAALKSGEILIGEKACYSADAVKRKLRFKSRFLTDPAVESDIRSFAAGVLGELYGSGDLIKNEDSCFYIGCPAGWDKNAREVYREIFERVGFPPARIISESRAAMVSACQSKHLQVGYDILSLPVLVVDIGSSTTDFAYICSGKEVEMQTAGEVRLGGGIMDEILLESAIRNSPGERAIRKVFSESEPWKSYCEFAARKLKEKYFTDRDYWEENPCSETVLIRYGIPTRLKLKMDRETAESLMEQKVESLGDRSFKEVFVNSLQDVRANITGALPELLFLTGGVSRMREIRTWCQEVFPEAVVVTGTEPEFSVSRGLAWSGRIDDELKEFRSELEELKASSVVEKIVEDRINDLYQSAVDTLVEPILTKVALPVFDRWREGEIRKLEDCDGILQSEIEAFLRTDETRELLMKPITTWIKPVSETALSLSSYLSATDINIRVDAKNVFAVGEITWLIDSIISILVGLLCGGSGVALITSGPAGIITGIMISYMVLLLGKNRMEGALLKTDLPVFMRKMIPKGAFKSRIGQMSGQIRSAVYEHLEKEKNEEITERMVNEISSQIELCLTKMAEVVEIPLG